MGLDVHEVDLHLLLLFSLLSLPLAIINKTCHKLLAATPQDGVEILAVCPDLCSFIPFIWDAMHELRKLLGKLPYSRHC